MPSQKMSPATLIPSQSNTVLLPFWGMLDNGYNTTYKSFITANDWFTKQTTKYIVQKSRKHIEARESLK